MKIGRVERHAKRFETDAYCEPLDYQINLWLLNHDEVTNRPNIQIFALSPTSCIVMYDEFIEDPGGYFME